MVKSPYLSLRFRSFCQTIRVSCSSYESGEVFVITRRLNIYMLCVLEIYLRVREWLLADLVFPLAY
jgi:hypothetical protein